MKQNKVMVNALLYLLSLAAWLPLRGEEGGCDGEREPSPMSIFTAIVMFQASHCFRTRHKGIANSQFDVLRKAIGGLQFKAVS